MNVDKGMAEVNKELKMYKKLRTLTIWNDLEAKKAVVFLAMLYGIDTAHVENSPGSTKMVAFYNTPRIFNTMNHKVEYIQNENKITQETLKQFQNWSKQQKMRYEKIRIVPVDKKLETIRVLIDVIIPKPVLRLLGSSEIHRLIDYFEFVHYDQNENKLSVYGTDVFDATARLGVFETDLAHIVKIGKDAISDFYSKKSLEKTNDIIRLLGTAVTIDGITTLSAKKNKLINPGINMETALEIVE